MNFKHLPLHVGLGFALAICGVVSQTPRAQAQSGNQSDVSGVTVTTSDIVGGFNFNTPRSDEQNNRIIVALNSSSVSINQQLQQGSLSIIATDISQSAISVTIQQSLLVILTSTSTVTSINTGTSTSTSTSTTTSTSTSSTTSTSTTNLDRSVTVIVNDLVNAGADVTLSRNLAVSMVGLTAGGKISVSRFQTATRSYNVFIDNCSVVVFENNPDSLRAIRSILAQLLNATYANVSR